MKVQLQDLGDAQTWTGEKASVIWECFFDSRGREMKDWQEQLAKVWQVVQRSMGVKKIYTTDHEPTIKPEVYRDFLERLGYAPEPASPRWWSKSLT